MNYIAGKFNNLPGTAWATGYDELHINVEHLSAELSSRVYIQHVK